MEKIFNDTNPVFEKFRKTPNVEFEFRFGKSFGTKNFDTNVGKATFEKVLRRLKKFNQWEAFAVTKDMVYSADPNLRLTIDDATDKQTQVAKHKIYKNDFSLAGKPFDVRFAVATEDPVSVADVEYTRVRQRVRESFLRKNVRIDLTVVTGDPNDMDCEEVRVFSQRAAGLITRTLSSQDTVYQIELEVVDPTKVENFYSVVYKIQNLLEIV